MSNLIPEPKTIQDAKRQIDRQDKAQKMSAMGYTARQFKTTDKAFYVDGGKETYLVYLYPSVHCSCPDFSRHKDCCKHVFFVIQEAMDALAYEAWGGDERAEDEGLL